MQIETFNGIIRPAVTAVLVLAQVGLAVAWAITPAAESAFSALSPFTMGVIVYYFKERSERHESVERAASVEQAKEKPNG